MSIRLRLLLSAPVLAGVLLVAACAGSAASEPTPRPGQASMEGATPGAAMRGTSMDGAAVQPAATAVGGTPTAIATPAATPTPEVRGEPIASTAALPRQALPLVEFVRDGKVIATLPVEVPPPSEYTVGFSGRRSLPDERGMLFYYLSMGRGAFWMKNTHFDLAIAFVASDETIVDIVEMQLESTELVTPKADYQYAVEAPSGWYLKRGVRLGDRARLAFPLPGYLTAPR